MQLKIPESDIESDDDEDEDEEIIKVMVHPRHKPPILIKKHELIRWSENLARETELSYSGELSLSDGFVGNWKEVKDCISLLQGNEVKVTFDNIKVFCSQFACHGNAIYIPNAKMPPMVTVSTYLSPYPPPN